MRSKIHVLVIPLEKLYRPFRIPILKSLQHRIPECEEVNPAILKMPSVHVGKGKVALPWSIVNGCTRQIEVLIHHDGRPCDHLRADLFLPHSDRN